VRFAASEHLYYYDYMITNYQPTNLMLNTFYRKQNKFTMKRKLLPKCLKAEDN